MTCILIEDDFAWKLKLQMMLDEIGVTVLGIATNIAEAKALLSTHKPNFIVSDILLGKEKVFQAFKEDLRYYKLPIIFITLSEMDIDYITAQKHSDYLYIVKPIHKLTLKSGIEKLCGTTNNNATKTINSLVIKGKFNQKIELPFEKIIYIQQTGHYSSIHTSNQKFVQKKSLANLLKELDERFMQVHRGYCVNKDHIQNFGVGLETLKLNNIEIPIGSTFREPIKEFIAKKHSLK